MKPSLPKRNPFKRSSSLAASHDPAFQQEEENIGSAIIGNLTPDGYLEVSVEEIAEASASDPEQVENVLSLMQTFDPVGVCARDLFRVPSDPGQTL